MLFISFWIIATSKHRSSSSEVSYKIGVLKNLADFTGKHLRQSLFLTKIQAGGLHIYYYRDSSTSVFLWILEQF